jgi:RloB-like protein
MARKLKNMPLHSKGEVIIGDGLCEKIYFDMMKIFEGFKSKIIPQLPAKSGSWNKVLDAAALLLEKEYQHVYCLIDFDKVMEEKAFEKYDKMRRNLEKKAKGKITILECNPCFEIWFLLHFQKTSKLFDNCNQVIVDLKKHISDYSKSEIYFIQKNIYTFLNEKQLNAIENAQFLELNRADFSKNYPRAEVYKLVQMFLNRQNE